MRDNRDITEEMKAIFNSKKEFRKERAKLPFEEKIKIVVQLQKIAKEASKNRKNQPPFPVWNID